MSKQFDAQVSSFVASCKQRLKALVLVSLQEVIADAQEVKSRGGRMPVDTSNLRNSFLISFDGMPPMQTPRDENSPPLPEWDAGQVILTLRDFKIGESVWGAWTAQYAMRIEHGFSGPDSLGRVYNQSGTGFLRLAVQKWQTIVSSNCEKIKMRYEKASR